MIKMVASSPIYGKNPLKISALEPEGQWPWDLVCSIGDVGPIKFVQKLIKLTMTYLKSRSNLLPNAFKWEMFWKVDFLNTVEV